MINFGYVALSYAHPFREGRLGFRPASQPLSVIGKMCGN
jgi:hypothetical protein